MTNEEFERAWMNQIAKDCEEIFAAHGIVPCESNQNFYYTGPPGPQPTLDDLLAIKNLPQTESEWKNFLSTLDKDV